MTNAQLIGSIAMIDGLGIMLAGAFSDNDWMRLASRVIGGAICIVAAWAIN